MRSSLDGASFRRRAGAGSEFRRGRDGPAAGRWERYSLDASGRACGDGDDGVRRLSLDSDGGFSAHSDTAQNTWCDTPGGRNVNTDAIIRQEYHRRIATQIWLSNLAPIFHYLGGSYHVLVTRGALWNWTPLQLQKLLCGCLSAGLLALCTLKKASALLPLRWQSTSESVMRHLLRVEVLTYFVINAAGFYEFHALADENCPRSTAAACGQRYFLTFHTAILPKCGVDVRCTRVCATAAESTDAETCARASSVQVDHLSDHRPLHFLPRDCAQRQLCRWHAAFGVPGRLSLARAHCPRPV